MIWRAPTYLLMLYGLAATVLAQATSSEILGVIQDPDGAAIVAANVRIRNVETNHAWDIQSNDVGVFRSQLTLPIGSYEVNVEKAGFESYSRTGIELRLNQPSNLGSITLRLAGTTTRITITADAPLINTTNPEVGVNFDAKRLHELPLSSDHNVLNVALSVPGVSQLSAGNSEQTASINFSVNGMRLRSNNFVIDGQDSNSLNRTGLAQEINNPDTIAEFRVLTHQFGAEYGRAAGSVVNIITRSGTNQLHGSAYWFHNDNKLNARSNLEEKLFDSAPWQIENQVGATLGGPIIKDRTFFFGSGLRWTDRRFATQAVTGVPTAEGQNILRTIAGHLPQVRALLENLPPAQTPIGQATAVTVGGQSADIPQGTLSGASSNRLEVWQASARLDQDFGNNRFGGRYLFDDRLDISGQTLPPGLTDQSPQRRQALSLYYNRFAPGKYNELRASYQRVAGNNSGTNAKAEEIPSIDIRDLGLRGGPGASPDRTAIGLATNLPSFNYSNSFHLTDVMGLLFSRHSVKFGGEVRRTEQYYLLGSSIRGRLVYTTLQNFLDDRAQDATFSLGGNIHRLRAYDFAFFAQDEWQAGRNLTMTFGLRYESPGTPLGYLEQVGEDIMAANSNDPAFATGPWPDRDASNWAPRVGFNYSLGRWPGLLGVLTGSNEMVLRGGYSRTYDQTFNQLFNTIASSFPFTYTFRPSTTNAFATIQAYRSGALSPVITATNQSRTTVSEDFRAPIAEQFALQLQRGLARDWALSAGWVATKGTALFQTVDGNPTLPFNNNGGNLRVDPTRGAIRLRCNCASSIYHSLQTTLERRFASGFSMAMHYTWSSFIDDASDVFNASATGDVAVSQDSFNRRADRGRSTYDRPHRFAANGVVELPFLRGERNAISRVFGGWQVSGLLTLQSGAPFSPLNGQDPGCRLCGISSQVGNAIRPNLNTTLDLSSMSLDEIMAAGGRNLFSPVTAENPIGNAGRNILRTDAIAKLDLGITRNLPLGEGKRLQVRGEFYNAFNSRNFGIPEANITTPGFGLKWDKDGGSRRAVVGIRYTF